MLAVIQAGSTSRRGWRRLMKTTEIKVERCTVVSAKSFEEVLAGLSKGIGRPNMSLHHERMASASSFAEYRAIIHEAVGSADLMEFLRLDLGAAMRKNPAVKAYKMVRIIAGNPLIMMQMAEHVPDAGSYAPVTILVYESHDGVHLCYDTMASLLASYKKPAATDVATALDSKVMKLLHEAAA
jgi:uncharacterized protein (DUF302 family)